MSDLQRLHDLRRATPVVLSYVPLRENSMAKLEGNYVEETDPPADNTFEIGLVMAGAISAGAYEAGVLDYLFEALDAWDAAKAKVKGTAEENLVPQHKVIIKVVTAASAGSMSAAVMAVAARYHFNHIGSRDIGVKGYTKVLPSERARIDEAGRHNPFFKAWVQDISMDKLLTTRDLDQPNSVLQSLLDSTALLEITKDCLAFEGKGVAHREYLGNPTRFIFAIGNLRGIPYFLRLSGQQGVGLGMSLHRDYRSFTVSYSMGGKAQSIKADDIALDWSSDSGKLWEIFGITAVASGAFPVGLAPRPMTRNSDDYQYRFVVIPASKTSPSRAVQLHPNMKRMGVPHFHSFLVDGGTMNNEPIDLARQELAGLTGRNERDGDKANRAVLMIDPFPDTEAQGTDALAGMSPALVTVVGNLIGAWKNQARFAPEDLALAADEDVFSRFLISPSRGDAEPRGPSLACGALGGFSGFLSRDYRQHDYLLGRRNAQKFLSDVFTLPVLNPLFNDLHADQKSKGGKWVRVDEKGGVQVPIIPLMDELLPGALSAGMTSGRMEELSEWPAGVFEIESIESAIKGRVDKIVSHAIENSSMGWFRRLSAKALGMILRGFIYDKVITVIKDGLADGELMPKRSSPVNTTEEGKWFGERNAEL